MDTTGVERCDLCGCPVEAAPDDHAALLALQQENGVALRMIATLQEERDRLLTERAALLALQQENEQLRAWKESALATLARTNVLHEALANRGEYLGWNVNEAIVDALQKAESKLAELRAQLERGQP
jgi:hypothetical protein